MDQEHEVAYQPGQMLAGKYRVERVLGIGGFGAVLAAMHLDLDKRVAIKVLLPHAAKNQAAAERFLREARAASRIRSEHVAQVIDVGKLEDQTPYMVMEYLDGTDLSTLVRTRGGQPVADVCEWIIQACEALAEAHRGGIIHRDLKPANLYLTHKVDGSPCIKVLDFGISKMAQDGGDKGMTKTSDVMGSPFYMSPEQMRSTRNVDARSDIWALGTILFELLAGAPPFDAETMTALVVSIMQERPRELSQYRSDVPPGLHAAIMKCLEKDPALRFQDVAELASGLHPFAAARAGVSVQRVLAVFGRTSIPTPISGPVPGSGPQTVQGTVPGVPLPPPTLPGDVSASGRMSPAGGFGASGGISSPRVGATQVGGPPILAATAAATPSQSWGGTYMGKKSSSKAPIFVGLGAVLAAVAGIGGFIYFKGLPEDTANATVALGKSKPTSEAPEAPASEVPATAAPQAASTGPLVAPQPTDTATEPASDPGPKKSNGTRPGKNGAKPTAEPTQTTPPPPLPTHTTPPPPPPTATTKPTATAPPGPFDRPD